MKSILKSMAAAVSMYSVLPVPVVKWDDKTLRGMLCFLPLVGVVIGAVQLVWLRLAAGWGLVPGLTGGVAVLLPVLLSGGVHMDGWADTWDAIGSHQSRERKLEIMADSAIGAFSVMGIAGYFLVSYGLWQQVAASGGPYLPAVLGPAMARAVGGAAMVLLPSAKPDGLGAKFSRAASKPAVGIACGLVVALGSAAAVAADGALALAAPVGSLLLAACFRAFCLRGFGGVTGDLTGWLISGLELFYVAVAALGGVIR